MPRSLFLKIFLWFGAVVITVIVATFLVGELTRPEPFRPPQRVPMDLATAVYAQTAAEIYERDGQSALVAYIDRLEHEQKIHAFLFNSQLQELSGRRNPAGAPSLAQKVLETNLPEFAANAFPPLLGRPALSARGDRYALVAELPPWRPQPGVLDHVLHMLAIILIGSLFCYWLARYLTSPVTKLRAATQELAAGNLSVRVAPALGKRRDELASLGADFDLMAEKLEALINSQRRLLGDISHELRSPLARLNVALELARQRAGADATAALERIQREAENLNEMIGQLLALTRLESGAEALRKTEFDLTELIADIVKDADFEAHSRNRSVTLKSDERCIILGTEPLLRRAIENIVRNGVQYTAEGTTVEVRLECLNNSDADELYDSYSNPERKVQRSKADGSHAGSDFDERIAVIIVRDHGSGVRESALPEIFRPFYRVDDARDREAGGVGLGLAIAERAVRLHGGSVAATNAPEGGLTVTIVLPKQTANS